MANWITAGRCLLLLVVVLIVYWGSPGLQLLNAPLVILMISLDGVDGYVARKRHEESVFGATFDIAADRIVENVLWVVLAHQGFIGVWVPLLFIVRGDLVDAIRSHGAAKGTAAFDMLESPVAQFLVGGRFMRGFYATIKATTFAWILLWQPIPVLAPDFWVQWSPLVQIVSQVLVLASAALCIIRGLPVIAEFVMSRERAA